MKNKKLLILFSAIVLLILFSVYINKHYSFTLTNVLNGQKNNKWQAYSNPVISFDYPSFFVAGEVQKYENYSQIIFKDPQERFQLSYYETANYNQEAGKPYIDFIEYIKIPYLKPIKYIDSYEVYQVLPRAGSEQVNAADFFSKDKPILTLKLETLTQDEGDRKNGQELFLSILNSFKILNK